MKEIEVLVMLEEEDTDFACEKIKKLAEFKCEKHVKDIYYYDPLRKNLQPDEKLALYECFRIRSKEDKSYLTYKVDRFDENGKWLYSDEDETEVADYEKVRKIILRLGLRELVVVDMTKYYFENKDYYIQLELVKNLGAFLEVESKHTDISGSEIINEKDRIEKFIKSLEINTSPDVGIGKPELLLKKQRRS